MPRQLDAELVEMVRRFRRRRRWRHVLAMILGAVALVLGTAIVAARLAHHGQAGLPSLGAGAGLYAAGALVSGWGAAGGFTSRLATWLPATLIFGLLAVLGFMLAAVFSTAADGGLTNGRPEGGGGRAAPPPSRPPNPPAASGRVLAAELLDRSDIERLLGPAPPDLQTPGATIARTRSLAIWRTAPALRPGGREARGPRQASVSLTVQCSARQARRLRHGRRPPGGQPMPGLPEGGYVRRHDGSSGRVTRVRACRGDWVVGLQLFTPAPADPAPLLAANVSHLLDLLTAASQAS